jgi:hypothetical protein
MADVGSLDLTGTPGASFHGLPTHFTWTIDGNESSGIVLSGASRPGGGPSFGSMDIRYIPGGQRPDRATGSGTFNAVVHGLIDTSGTLSNIALPGARRGHP